MSSDQLLSKKWILCRGRGIYPKVPPAARKHSKGSPGSADHFMYPRFGNVCPLVGYPARDEVIVPSFTFVSTANPFVLSGAHIRFSDIHPDTLNLDENQLENLDTLEREPFRSSIMPESVVRWIASLTLRNDMELCYKCIKETRTALKKKTHLSPKLIQDLLVANNEISLLLD